MHICGADVRMLPTIPDKKAATSVMQQPLVMVDFDIVISDQVDSFLGQALR